MKLIRTHKELEVYQLAFHVAVEIYLISKMFPIEEKYSLTDQIRRSSRSVCSNIAEAFRKRRYPKSLYQNFQIQKEKLLRHKFGLILQWNLDILEKKSRSYFMIIMTIFCLRL